MRSHQFGAKKRYDAVSSLVASNPGKQFSQSRAVEH
jgi:hypothetical protein